MPSFVGYDSTGQLPWQKCISNKMASLINVVMFNRDFCPKLVTFSQFSEVLLLKYLRFERNVNV